MQTCLPALVRPRASRRLWTGLTIQLILGSRRIYEIRFVSNVLKNVLYMTDRFVVGVDEDNFIVFVNTVLVDPVGVQHPQITASPADTLLCNTPEAPLEFEVIYTLSDGVTVCRTYLHYTRYFSNLNLNVPLGTGFFLLPRRTRTR